MLQNENEMLRNENDDMKNIVDTAEQDVKLLLKMRRIWRMPRSRMWS